MFGLDWVKIIIIIAILGAITGGYFYVTHLQKENAQLTADLSVAQLANKTLVAERQDLEQRLAVSMQEQNKLNEKITESREKYNSTVKIFSNHDFTELAKKKPGLINNRMKAATKKIFDEIEEESNK